MKLVRQIKLYFQEGTSDKVYEIDLCESGDGYLVNFRYGRRGASLRDGTKTIFPVTLADAEKIFLDLENEKRKKGYVAAGEAPVVVSSEPRPSASSDKRKKVIIKTLKAAASGEEPENWSLSRIIWRVGDLKIREAIPYIIKLADPSDPFNIYSVIWTLGRCGSKENIPFLKELKGNNSLAPHTQQLIDEVLLKYAEGKDKEDLITAIVQTLPSPIKRTIEERNYKQLARQLREYLFALKTSSNEYLTALYQLSRQDPALHAICIQILEDVPLSKDYFKHLRHIFKTAEMLEDYSIYAVLAKNIEKKQAGHRSNAWTQHDNNSEVAFSNKTKGYLAKRVVRLLRKYGEVGEPIYTELATELLLAFEDGKDMTPAYQRINVQYRYDAATRRHTREESVDHFDQYARFQAFNLILFKNSPRYVQTKNGWMCVPPFKPGGAAPHAREEAYPHLWNKAPEEIIRLLSLTGSGRVNDFAQKVFKANSSFEDHVEIQHLIQFLKSPFLITQQLGLRLARKKYDRLAPDKLLLIAMMDNSIAEARDQASQWINEERVSLLADAEFVVSLLKMQRTEAHQWLRVFLSSSTIPKEQTEIIVAKAIAFLVSFEMSEEADNNYITQFSDTLMITFPMVLRSIGLDIVRDLFRHSSTVMHAVAGKLLMMHEIKAEDLPEDFIQVLLQSDNPESRNLGISLLGKFSDRLLLQKKDILVSFCLSPLQDVRNSVRPLIFKLVKTYPEFGKELVDLFVPAFLMKESYEGLHSDLLGLLAHELNESLKIISKERSLLLLHSRFKAAQQMGLILLRENIPEEDITMVELVKMASNPQQEVRTFAWNAFRKYQEKVKLQKEDALKIADSYWDDTRIFAFDYFRNNFTQEDWTMDLLVSLCDSVREDVQDFGREMITHFFQAADGKEYLLKLSQHPSSKVQLFTTAYLEQYASANLETIQTLKSYFVTLLSQVNKGRVAKTRVMDFLKRESLRDEDTARFVSEILTRVSVSVSSIEKVACIAALRDIETRFPSVKSPLVVKQYADYVKS